MTILLATLVVWGYAPRRAPLCTATEEYRMRLYRSSGSLTLVHWPLFRLFLDWRDAADGRTLIRPRLTLVWRPREWQV